MKEFFVRDSGYVPSEEDKKEHDMKLRDSEPSRKDINRCDSCQGTSKVCRECKQCAAWACWDCLYESKCCEKFLLQPPSAA